MTVKDLQAILALYDEDTRVRIFDSEAGIIDITDMFTSERTGDLVLSQRPTSLSANSYHHLKASIGNDGRLLPISAVRVARGRRDPLFVCLYMLHKYLFESLCNLPIDFRPEM